MAKEIINYHASACTTCELDLSGRQHFQIYLYFDYNFTHLLFGSQSTVNNQSHHWLSHRLDSEQATNVNKSVTVECHWCIKQLIAWHQLVRSYYLNLWWSNLLVQYGINRPQWVNSFATDGHAYHIKCVISKHNIQTNISSNQGPVSI